MKSLIEAVQQTINPVVEGKQKNGRTLNGSFGK